MSAPGSVRRTYVSLAMDPDPALLAQRIAQLPLPDLVTESPITIWLGARRVDVRPAEGHTGGDLVVSVPDAKVLFCGDLLWRMPPNIVDGTVSKWIATDRSFEHLPEAASMVFVPGHGDVATVKDVAIFRSYLMDLMSLTEAGRKNGLKGDALAADVVPKLHASHSDYSTPTHSHRGDVDGTGTGRNQARAPARAVIGIVHRHKLGSVFCDPWPMSASLIGRLGSSAFRLSTMAVLISLTGSRFSSESAPRPFQHGVRGRSGTIFGTALPAD